MKRGHPFHRLDVVDRLRLAAAIMTEDDINPVVWSGPDGVHVHTSEVLKLAIAEIERLRSGPPVQDINELLVDAQDVLAGPDGPPGPHDHEIFSDGGTGYHVSDAITDAIVEIRRLRGELPET